MGDNRIMEKMLKLISKHNYGLTIEDVANILNINRMTASKYLAILEATNKILVREVGKAKLHYPKDKKNNKWTKLNNIKSSCGLNSIGVMSLLLLLSMGIIISISITTADYNQTTPYPLQASLTIYPVEGSVIIYINGPPITSFELTVMNADTQSVLLNILPHTDDTGGYKLSISELKPGNYSINLTSNQTHDYQEFEIPEIVDDEGREFIEVNITVDDIISEAIENRNFIENETITNETVGDETGMTGNLILTQNTTSNETNQTTPEEADISDILENRSFVEIDDIINETADNRTFLEEILDVTEIAENRTFIENQTIETYLKERIMKLISDKEIFKINEKPKLRLSSKSTFSITGGLIEKIPKPENINTFIYGPDKKLTNLKAKITELSGGEFDVEILKDRAFRPGLYKLVIIENNTRQEVEFLWGVLAINTHKSIYLPNEKAFIGIAVLDDHGHMVCDAEVILEITDPNGGVWTLTTLDGTIKVSNQCEIYGVTDLPDYYTNFNVGDPGTYIMKLTAITPNGTRALTDMFEVRNQVDFDVERKGPTRIYPLEKYTMGLIIKANKHYEGIVKEFVPASYVITPQNGLIITALNETQSLTWSTVMNAGQTYVFDYEFDAPDISPQLFTLGELGIGNWTEARQWMIASDAPWGNETFERCINITINNAGTSTLTNFPAYINLSYYEGMQPNFIDIKFYNESCDMGGNELDYEIENYTTSDRAHIWVRIPTLSSSGKTISIYYKNNTAVASGENTTGVWDDGYFRAVWHMTETDAEDSTSNNNDGTAYNDVTLTSSGRVDGADIFDGDNDAVNVSDSNSLDIIGNITLSAWIYIYNTPTQYPRIISKEETTTAAPYSLSIQDTGRIWLCQNFTDGGNEICLGTAAGVLSANTWYHVVGVYNGTYQAIYVNGDEKSKQSISDTMEVTDYDVLIGCNPSLDSEFNGTIDEARISNTTRSVDWINQSYLMVANQSDYVSFGGVEGQGVTLTGYCQELGSANTVYELNRSITSTSGNCFNITTDNITFDGKGYSLGYATTGQGKAIYANGTNITIKNLKINQTSTSRTNSPTIHIENSENNNITNVTFEINGDLTAYNHIVYLENTINSTIENNNITVKDNCEYCDGIRLEAGNQTTIQNNSINVYGNYGSGIYIYNSSNCIVNQTLVNATSSVQAYTMRIEQYSDNNLITDSEFTSNSYYTFSIEDYSDNNNITNTNVSSLGYEALRMEQSSTRTHISNSKVECLYRCIIAYDSDNGTIDNCNVTGGPYNAEQQGAIYLSSGKNWIINNTHVTGTGSRNEGIYIFLNSDNTRIENTVVKTSGNEDAVALRVDNLDGEVIVIDTVLNASNSNDTKFVWGDTGNTNFTNVTFSDRYWSAGSHTLNVHWYLDVYVNKTDGSTIEGADVEANDTNGDQWFSEQTGASGKIPQQTLLEYKEDNTGATYYTNYTVNASKTDYTPNSTEVNITTNKVIYLTLESIYTYVGYCQELDTENTIYRLNQSINSTSGNCFNITADNITLDGNGYSLGFATTGDGKGIYADDAKNITIRNFNNINQTNTTRVNNYGIHITNSDLINITNCTFDIAGEDTPDGYDHAIYFENVTNSTIARNDVTMQGSCDYCHGIHLTTGSHNATIEHNTITTLGGYYGSGILINAGDNHTIYNNTFDHNSNNWGALRFYNVDNSLIDENNIDVSPSNFARAIEMIYYSENNLINNTVITTIDNEAIYIYDNCDNNSIINTNITGSGSGASETINFEVSSHGGYIENVIVQCSYRCLYVTDSNDWEVHNSNFTQTVTGFQNAYLYSTGWLINNSRFTSTGVQGHGIEIRQNCNGGKILNSKIKTYGTSAAFAIYTICSSGTVEVVDSSLNAVNANDMWMSLSNVEYNFTNTTFAEILWDTGSAKLNLHHYFELYVNDTDGNDIQDANVTLYDKNNQKLFEEQTNSSGQITRKVVLEYVQNTSGTTYKTPHNINVVKTDYYEKNESKDIDGNKDIYITLINTSLPDVQIISPEQGRIYTNLTVLVNITNSSNTDFTWYVWNFTNYTYNQPVEFNFTTEGNHNITAYANNSNGTSSDFVEFEISLTSVNLTDCQDLDSPGIVYELNQSITGGSGECFHIKADDVVIEGNGYTLTYANSGVGIGIYTDSYKNITIRNLKLTQSIGTRAVSPAIKLENSQDNNITNVTMDIDGEDSPDAHNYGIEFINTINSEITRSDFTAQTLCDYCHAIYLESGSHNITVEHNDIYTAGDYARGIYSHSSDNHTIYNNTIDVNDANSYGVYLYQSDYCVVNKTRIYASGGTGAIRFEISDYNVIDNIYISTIDSDAIYFYNSADYNNITNTEISNNNYRGISFELNSHGAYINNVSITCSYQCLFVNSGNNWELHNANLTMTGASNEAIYLYANGWIINNTNITVTGSTNGQGIEFRQLCDGEIYNTHIKTYGTGTSSEGVYSLCTTASTIFKDSTINSINDDDIYFSQGGGNFNFTNTTFADVVWGISPTVKANVHWYLDVYVNETDDSTIEGADVEGNDTNGYQWFSEQTLASGKIPQQTVLEYWMNKSQTKYYTNYTVNASKTDYTPNSTEVNLTTNKVIYLTLEESTNYIGYCANLSTADETYPLNQSVNSTGTCFNISADNITLNCGGYTINYSQSTSGHGVDSTYVNYTTIKNCNIIGSTPSISNSEGILFNNTHFGLIYNNTIIPTTGSSYTGDGIIFYRSHNNTIKNNNITVTTPFAAGIDFQYTSGGVSSYNNITNNTITGTGNSWGITTCTSDSTFSNNTISTENNAITGDCQTRLFLNNNTQKGKPIISHYDNDSITIENDHDIGELILTLCDNVTVRNLSFSVDGIVITGGSNVTIENSTIAPSGKYIPGVRLTYGTTKNTIRNTNITVNNSYGIEFSSVHNTSVINSSITVTGVDTTLNPYYVSALIFTGAATNNSITGCILNTTNNESDNIYGIGIFWGWAPINNTRITDTIITTTRGKDIYMRNNYTHYLTNVSFDKNNVSFYSGVNGTLKVFWYLDTYVNNTLGDDVEGANITAWNNQSEQIFSEDTLSSGWISQQTLLEYWQNETNITYYTNYTINVTKTNYNENSTEVNLTTNKVVYFTLNASINISLNLDPNPVYVNYNVTIYGHLNDSEGNNITNNTIKILLDGSEQTILTENVWGGEWWNLSWYYRREINVESNVSSDLNNTIAMVNFSTSNLISEGKMNSDCGDVRFTDSSGNELSHTVETSTCDSGDTVFWVWLNLTGDDNTTVYAYYGNAGAAINTSYTVPDKGMVLYMHLDNSTAYGETSTNFYDFSKNGNSGTCSGADCPEWNTSGKFGNMYEFDGGVDIITLGDKSSLEIQNITLMTWFIPKNYTTNQVMIGKAESTGAGTDSYILGIIGSLSQYWFRLRNTVPEYKILRWSTGSVSLNEWHHMASTYDGQDMKLYIDGELVNQTSWSSTIIYGDGKASIGGGYQSDVQADWFNGTLDEVRIYNRSLSFDEILAIYNSTKNYYIEERTLTSTDSYGKYNYTIKAPATPGNYTVNVSASYSGFYTEAIKNLTVNATDIGYCKELNIEGMTYKLNQSVSSADTCFNITADNITLDCQGHLINYSESSTGYAINNSDGNDFITVKNCVINQTDGSNTYSYGIYYYGSENGTIENNSIKTESNGGSNAHNYGIYLYEASDYNNITDNNITTMGRESGAMYIRTSDSNRVENNNLTTLFGQSEGIYIYSGNSNLVIYNKIIVLGDLLDGHGVGIRLISGSYNNISFNTLNVSYTYSLNVNGGTTAAYYNNTIENNTQFGKPILYYFDKDSMVVEDRDDIGQLAFGASTNITIRNITQDKDGIFLWYTTNSNVTNCNVTIPGGYGIEAKYGSDYTNISNNFISTSGYGGKSIHIISSDDVNANNNTIITTGGRASGIYFDVVDSSNITNNNINISGNNYAHGIEIYQLSDSNLIENNTVNTTGSDSYAISISRDMNSNFVVNNIFATSGSNSHGIYLNRNANTTNITRNTVIVENPNAYVVYMGSTPTPTNNRLYDNIFNSSTAGSGVYFGGTYNNSWNTTKQSGINILGNPYIGGNYWTNKNSTGFSDNCTDSDADGICDSYYNLSIYNIDYHPLATGAIIGYCRELNEQNTIYKLNQTVTSPSTCFNITAHNITIDCIGYNINYSQTSTGYGVNNTEGYDNITIKNCNFRQEDHWYTHSILFNNSINLVIINNTILQGTSYGYPIILENECHNANISYNNINQQDVISSIYLYSSDNVTIHNNNITLNGQWWATTPDNHVTAITLYDSKNATLNNNNITSTYWQSVNVIGSEMEHFNHTIGEDNIINNMPIKYIAMVNDTTYQDQNWSNYEVLVFNSTNLTFSNLTLDHMLFGERVTNATLENSTIKSTALVGLHIDSYHAWPPTIYNLEVKNNIINHTINTRTIFLHGIENSNFTNNTILNTGTQITITQNGNVDYNFYNNTINSTNAPGIDSYSGTYNVTYEGNVIETTGATDHYGLNIVTWGMDHLYLKNNKITSSGPAIRSAMYISSGGDVIINDSILNSTSSYDILIVDNTNGTINLTNATLGNNNISWPASTTMNLSVHWYLDVNVTNSSGDPLNGADVDIYNNYSELVYSGSTGSDGLITTQTLIEYWQNITNTSYYTNYTINVSRNGYYNESAEVNLTTNKVVYFSLDTLNITLNLNPNPANTSQHVYIYGHLNKSDGTNVTNNTIHVYLNGTECYYNVDAGLLDCGLNWWNDSWNYRKEINTYSYISSNLVDTIIMINFSTVDLISEGKMNSDCGDVRFTNSSEDELFYTMETSTCNTSNTIFWVWSSLTGSSNTTLYAYYSNSAANLSTSYTNPDNGLVAYYHFDNSSEYGENDSIVYDFSRNGNNGSTDFGTSSPQWTSSGKFGGAYYFDGDDDHIRFTDDAFNSYSEGTLLWWFKPTDIQDSWGNMFGADGSTDIEIPYRSDIDEVAVFCGGTQYSVGISNPTDWHHFAWKVNSSGSYLFLDGEFRASNPSTCFFDDLTGSTVYYTIACVAHSRPDCSGSEMFNGTIDEFRIYNHPLTEDEILAIYNSTKDYFSTLTNLTTDGYGNYNYTLTTPSTEGNYTVKVNTTYNGAYVEDTETLELEHYYLNITLDLEPNPANATKSVYIYGNVNNSYGNNVTNHPINIYFENSWYYHNNNTGLLENTTPWWNKNWEYRKQVNVDSSVSSDTDYMIAMINFPTTDLINQSMMNDDCGDVRFADSSGNELSHTIETSTCNTSNTYFWVWTNLTGSSNTTVYAYYGNSIASLNTSYTNPDDGLILYMHFDNSSAYGENDTHVYDFSRNGNNGNMTNDTFINTSGKFGGAAQFDGDNDFINISNEANFDFENDDPFSAMAWVKVGSISGNWQLITIKGYNSSSYRGWSPLVIRPVSPNAPMGITLCSTWDTNVLEVYGNDVVGDNQWHHIVTIYNGSTNASGVKLYVDGKLQTNIIVRDTLTETILTNEPLRLGSREGGPYPYPVDGLVDEIRIYNRTLTQDDVLAIYNATKDYYLSNHSKPRTDDYGNYNYTLTAPNIAVNHTVKVNATKDSMYGENTSILTVRSGNIIGYCKELNIENAVYTLNQSVMSAGTCFNITAHNVTLDCQGYNINYSDTETGHGVNNSHNRDNITVKNCVINQTVGSNFYSYGIYYYNSAWGTITNNTIRTSGSGGSNAMNYGIYIYTGGTHNITYNDINTSGRDSRALYTFQSSSNIIEENTLTTTGPQSDGIYIWYGSGNRVVNNTIVNIGIISDGMTGIRLGSTSYNNVSFNTVNTTNGPAFIVVGSTSTPYYNNTIENNTQFSKPVIYYFDISSTTIEDRSDMAQLIVAASTNVTIRNITQDMSGIYVLYTNDSRVTDCNITVSKYYGISVNYASHYVNITDNYIKTSNDRSTGIGAFSSNNMIIDNNTIITTTGTRGFGVYLNYDDYANVTNNNISTSNQYGYGVHVYQNARYSRIENNTIYTSGSDSHGISFERDLISNTAINNTVTTSGSGSIGIRFYNNASFTTVRDSYIETTHATGHLIFIENSSDNLIKDTVINATSAEDIWIQDTGTGTNNLTNVTFNQTKIHFETGTTGTLNVHWYLDVNVTNSTGDPINGADVDIYNNYSELVYSGSTGSNGLIPTRALIEYWQNASNISYYTNYTINVSMSGYNNNSVEVNLTTNKAAYITLQSQSQTVGYCKNLDNPNTVYTLNQSVASDGTCFNITANNVTLDCNGYTINYSANYTGYGVNSSNVNYTTVKDCVINKYNSSIAYAHAIIILGRDANITNNTIWIVGPGNPGGIYGVYLSTSANDSTVSNNNITITSQGGNFCYGCSAMVIDSSNSIVENNTAQTDLYYSYVFWIGGNNNTVYKNTIKPTISIGGAYGGISLSGSSHNVSSNTISGQWSPAGDRPGGGIRDSSTSSTITYNNISATAGYHAYGLWLYGSTNTTILNNKINTSSSQGVVVYGTTASHYNHSIGMTNLVEGLPVAYNFSVSDQVLYQNQDLSSTYGQLICARCDNVTYDNVTMYNDGINLYNTSNSKIINSNINSSKGLGIWIYSNSNYNNISNNNITTSVNNKLYGIWLYSDSNNNNITNNNITTFSNAIFLYSVSNNNITDNTFNSDIHVLYIFESDYNVFARNSITATGSSAYGAYLRRSTNNFIDNSTITTIGTDGRGIHINHESIPTINNTIIRSKITTTGSSAYGVYFYSAASGQLNFNNYFNDTIINATNANDIYIDSSRNGNLTFTNATFNKSDVGFNTGTIARLKVFWYLDVYVDDIQAAALPNANVTSWNSNSEQAFSQNTTYTGWIPTQTLLEYWQNETTTKYYTNYTVNVTNDGYYGNSTEVNLTTNKQVYLTLNGTQWINDSFDMCKNITISNTGSSMLYNFPAYINLTYDSDMQPNFIDARFYGEPCGDGGKNFDYEIENYTTSDRAHIWVRIPSLPSSGRTISIYYKNNTAVASGENAEGVWDEYYEGVWHLKESSSPWNDSTSNNRDSSASDDPTQAEGKIAQAQKFEANFHNYIRFGSNPITGTNPFTIEIWVKFESTVAGGRNAFYIGEPAAGELAWVGSNNLNYWAGFFQDQNDLGVPVDLNNFKHIVATFAGGTGGTFKAYVDGVEKLDTTKTPDLSSTSIEIGGGGISYEYDGIADEARLSNIPRSADWINQSYLMVANQSDYVTFGDEISRPGSCSVDFNMTITLQNGIAFGVQDPNTNISAAGNGFYNVTDLSNTTCFTVNVSIRATGDLVNGSDSIGIGNVTVNSTSSGSQTIQLSTSYQLMRSGVPADTENVTDLYFWLSVPPGQVPKFYNTTIYVREERE